MNPLPEGRFGAILADPRWSFRTYANDNVQRKSVASLVKILMDGGALVEKEERDPVRR